MARRTGLWFLIGFILLLIVIFFIVPLIQKTLTERERQELVDEYRYNGFTFMPESPEPGAAWETELTVNGQAYSMLFHHHPSAVDAIPLEEGIVEQIIYERPRVLFLTFPPDAPSTLILAGVEISKITGDRNGEYGVLQLPTRGAMQAPPAGNATFPVLTCANATSQAVIMSFDQGEQNRIYRDENANCIRLEYLTPDDAVRVADRFSYGLLQII